MTTSLRKPTDRVCERCGREERWEESLDAWQLVRVDDEPLAGNPHCIHEWDITGTFNPVEEP